MHVPLVELDKNPLYQKQIEKVLHGVGPINQPDNLNVLDEFPIIIFGPHISNKEAFVAPFYVTLNIHDKLIPSYMLDYGASHNLMPKMVMKNMGLEITRPYHVFCSFYSRKVKCEGMIKDLVVTLSQSFVKSIIMNVVVEDGYNNITNLTRIVT